MQIGKRSDSENVIVYLNIEGDVTDGILDKLRSNIAELEDLWYVQL